MEFGFWRPRPGGGIEVISAHPNGIAEVEVGTIDGTHIALRTQPAREEPVRKTVVRLERDFVVRGDALAYDVRMEAWANRSGRTCRPSFAGSRSRCASSMDRAQAALKCLPRTARRPEPFGRTTGDRRA